MCQEIFKNLEEGAASVALRRGYIVENLINSPLFTIGFVFKRPKLQIKYRKNYGHYVC